MRRVIRFFWNATRGHHLAPWRSPYLRWRIETYAGWHAERITSRDFWRFTWSKRRELIHFLDWADRMDERSSGRV